MIDGIAHYALLPYDYTFFCLKHVSGFKNRVSVLKPVNRVTLHPKPIILYQNKLNNNLYIIFTDYYEQQQNIYFIISVI